MPMQKGLKQQGKDQDGTLSQRLQRHASQDDGSYCDHILEADVNISEIAFPTYF